jgi:hypothetical protein
MLDTSLSAPSSLGSWGCGADAAGDQFDRQVRRENGPFLPTRQLAEMGNSEIDAPLCG